MNEYSLGTHNPPVWSMIDAVRESCAMWYVIMIFS